MKEKGLMKSRTLLCFIGSLALWSAGALLFGNSAIAETKTAQSGNVRAEFSSQEKEYCLSNLRLKIIRQGKTVWERSPSSKQEGCRLADLQVRDIDGNKEPEVILDLYTGGAHCCTFSLVYRYDPTQKQYKQVEHFWGNGGYQFKDLDRDNVPEFYSQDDRFAYAFASYAGSSYPLQIWQYREGRMTDVTRRYPQLVYSDAYQLWQRYTESRNQHQEVARAALAAYLADKYLLGQGEEGWRRVQQAYQGSDRASFFRELRSFLQKTGYVKASR